MPNRKLNKLLITTTILSIVVANTSYAADGRKSFKMATKKLGIPTERYHPPTPQTTPAPLPSRPPTQPQTPQIDTSSIAVKDCTKSITAIPKSFDNALYIISGLIVKRSAVPVGAGDNSKTANNVWVKASIGSTTQKGEDDAFKTQQDGFTIGADIDAIENTLLVGIAYTKVDLKAKIRNKNKKAILKADSNIISAYGRYMITDNVYATAIASIADVKIKVPTSKTAHSAKAFKGETNITANMNLSDDIFISPKIGISYQSVKIKNVSTKDIKLSFDKNKKIVGSISVSLGMNYMIETVTLTPEIHVGALQALTGGKNKTTISEFDGIRWNELNTSAIDSKNKEKTTYNLGGSIKIASSGSANVDLGYDCNFRKKYKANIGFIKFSLTF